MNRRSKLARLAEIAELKATLAKGGASQVLAEAESMSEQIKDTQDARHTMASHTPDPANARAHAAWMRQCDQTLRDLRSEQARVRVRLDVELDKARYEEGRRQVLDKLKTQAS